jgi:hypothetical protein
MLIASGCGGNEDDGPREEFIRAADAICRESQERAQPLEERVSKLAEKDPDFRSREPALAGRIGRELGAIRADADRDLAALTPPEDDREAFEEWLEARRQLTDAALAHADAEARGDAEALVRARQTIIRYDPLNSQRARVLGLEDCPLS